MVNAFPSLLQKFLEGVSRSHALDEFDLGIPDRKEGDLCLFRLYRLGPLAMKPQHFFEEPLGVLHAANRHGDVGHFLNHRSRQRRGCSIAS